MAEPRLLRIPRSDLDQVNHVLIKVEPRTTNGTLDAKLIGTEGENPYVASIKPSQAAKWRAANYHGTDREWQSILAAILFRDDPVLLDGIETVATVTADEGLSIVVRKNIGGITQRLGHLTLRRDDGEEIELFDWTSIATLSATKAQEEAAALECRFKEQEDTVAKLNAQLDQLAKAKQEHEAALLEKFKLLLNAKKLKIRDQQRLLAGAQVNKESAENVLRTRNSTSVKPRRAGPSRDSKRKAPTSQTPPNVGTAVNQGDDDAETEDEEEMRDAQTPDKSELDETEDEDEFASAPRRSGPGSKGKTSTATKEEEKKQTEEVVTSAKGVQEQPPPRRELPFLRNRESTKPNTSPAIETKRSQNAAEEDEETEDEL